MQVHESIDEMEQTILQELGIHIVIHMDPIAVHSPVTLEMREKVSRIAQSLCAECSIHDFRITDGEHRINLIFDLAVPCDMSVKDRAALSSKIDELVKQEDARCHTVITVENSMMV